MSSPFLIPALLCLLPCAFAQSASSAAAPSGANSTAASASGATTLTFSLSSTDASALPLSSIVGNVPSAPTTALQTTFTSNSAIPSAPALPDAASLKPASYPTLDKPPPTDSNEVKGWMQEIQNAGVTIPNISPTVLGGCAANPQAVADSSRCWWTCSGCVRGTDIDKCPTKNTWGLTYDDGPSPYTPQLLNYLESQSLKATFFVVGSRVISTPVIAQQEYLAGHQVGVHTWSHPYLTTLSNEEIVAELGWTRKVIKDALGVTPTTMRPPYGDIDDRVRAISLGLGLTPVMWTRQSVLSTFDTDDFNVHAGLTTPQQVLNNWQTILTNASSLDSGFIVLEHDLFQQTVELATGYLLPDAKARGLKIEPVITCQNKDISAAYAETNKTSSSGSSGNSGLSVKAHPVLPLIGAISLGLSLLQPA